MSPLTGEMGERNKGITHWIESIGTFSKKGQWNPVKVVNKVRGLRFLTRISIGAVSVARRDMSGQPVEAQRFPGERHIWMKRG
jgi:hypothetical protein